MNAHRHTPPDNFCAFLLGTKTSNSTSIGQVPAFLPNYEIVVDIRPVTATGMAGIKQNSGAPIKNSGRQMQDASYFVALLRSKCEAIKTEIEKLNAETDRVERESEEEKELKAKHDKLLEDVKELEGSLTDYNLAIDKYRDGMDPDKILEYHKQLAAKNRKFVEEVDQVFLKKTLYERENAKFQGHITDFFIQAEEFIRKTEPGKLHTFLLLLKQSNELSSEIQMGDSHLGKLGNMIYHAEHTMRGKNLRDEYKLHEKRVQELKIELIMGQDDLKVLQMNPKDAHALQLEKLKQCHCQIATLDEAIVQRESQKAELKRMEQTLDAEIANEGHFQDSRPSENNIVLFLQNFEDARSQLKHEQEQTQLSIDDLSERIRDSVALSVQDLPTKEEYEEMKSNATFKSRHLQTSQQTMDRLHEQKIKRVQEVGTRVLKTCIIHRRVRVIIAFFHNISFFVRLKSCYVCS